MVWNTGLSLARWGQLPPPGCAPSWSPVKINPVLAKPWPKPDKVSSCLAHTVPSGFFWDLAGSPVLVVFLMLFDDCCCWQPLTGLNGASPDPGGRFYFFPPITPWLAVSLFSSWLSTKSHVKKAKYSHKAFSTQESAAFVRKLLVNSLLGVTLMKAQTS